MKSLSTGVGWTLIIFYSLYALVYWGYIFGGVGYFGAIITWPISVILAFVFAAFTSIPSLIFHVLLGLAIYVLLTKEEV